MLTLSGVLVYMARMIGAMSNGSKHARKEGDKFAGQRVVMDDALGGSIVTAVIRDASGETGLMQHIIGEEEEDIRVTGNAMLGPCISGGPADVSSPYATTGVYMCLRTWPDRTDRLTPCSFVTI